MVRDVGLEPTHPSGYNDLNETKPSFALPLGTGLYFPLGLTPDISQGTHSVPACVIGFYHLTNKGYVSYFGQRQSERTGFLLPKSPKGVLAGMEGLEPPQT